MPVWSPSKAIAGWFSPGKRENRGSVGSNKGSAD